MLAGVRGATTVSENQADAIQHAVTELMTTLVDVNHIAPQQIVSVFFTVTPDLTAINPAKALRLAQPTWDATPLLCSQEPRMEGMLARCIRVLIQWECTAPGHPITPIYLREAATLRPDLASS